MTANTPEALTEVEPKGIRELRRRASIWRKSGLPSTCYEAALRDYDALNERLKAVEKLADRMREVCTTPLICMDKPHFKCGIHRLADEVDALTGNEEAGS